MAERRRIRAVALVVLFVVLLLVVVAAVEFLPATLLSTGAPHDHARVTVVDENGTRLGVVDARVADTWKERYRGLSGVETLPNGTGMLFVHAREAERTYVMRDMNVSLDMVFVGADRRVTAVHRAPLPPPNATSLTRYSGRAKWVVEVPMGWTSAHGVSPGDRVRIDYG